MEDAITAFIRRRGVFCLWFSDKLLELLTGSQLLTAPSKSGNVYGLASCLISAFGLGLIRAWVLLGAQRYGLLGWLSPLRALTDSELIARGGNAHTAGDTPPSDETVPRSPSQ